MIPQYNTGCYFSSLSILPLKYELSDNAALILKDYGSKCEQMSFSFPKGHVYGVEIQAESRFQAESIADILCSAHTVISGCNSENPEDIIIRLSDGSERESFRIGTLGVVYRDEDLFFACQLAQKAYQKQSWKNALCRYHVAHEIYALHPLDLHPYEDPFKNNRILSEHIRIANVITACYGVLEELNLQIKADCDHPSTIDGNWNPEIKSDLITRLHGNHLNPEISIPWLTRNGIKRPFKQGAINSSKLCEWSDGQNIGDFEINICDAILELSYMRSQIATHKIGNKVHQLSVYDAENAFALSRIVLLGFFQIDIYGFLLKE